VRFLALDSWRGLCAVLVAAMHFQGAWHFYDASFLHNCYLLVDFFFVLSGFVLAHAQGYAVLPWGLEPARPSAGGCSLQ
jgi:peptidoglycan/LPS O-acetylase OafA/YrhL